MGNALVTLILVTVVMVSALGLVSGSVSALDMLVDSSKEMQDQACDRGRTSISCVSADVEGDLVTLRVANDGSVPLSGFANWDLIVQYRDMENAPIASWLPYGNTLDTVNEWTVDGIYFADEPETVEPGALNPGEEAEIQFRLQPAIGLRTTNLVTVATDMAVSAQLVFEGEKN